MSYNGSGTFQINTSGQPVVAGTVISSTAFNALTADLATGLSTAITKDGQTTTTARIPFAAGINSSLTTDSTSTSTGSIITSGGVGIAKALYVGTTANVAGAVTLQSTLGVTGVATFSAAPIYSSLTASSAVATDASKALVSVTNTGTGNNVLATSPTLVTPVLGAASATSITVDAGAVGTPSITTTGDTNTGIFFPAADTIAFAEGGAEAMRINSSGNVGIGTTSPLSQSKLTVAQDGAATAGGLTVDQTNGSSNRGGGIFLARQTDNRASIESDYFDGLIFSNKSGAGSLTEKMRIDTSGNVGIGTSSPVSKLQVVADQASYVNDVAQLTITGTNTNQRLLLGYNTSTDKAFIQATKVGTAYQDLVLQSGGGDLLVGTTTSGGVGISFVPGSSSSTPEAYFNKSYSGNINGVRFLHNSTYVGGITYSNTNVAYATSASDYRLKENIVNLTGALNAVISLRPVSFTWKNSQENDIGFIAHEIQSVIPNTVFGEKDEVDANGNPKYQSIFPAPAQMIANLVGAIQEQQALIQSLTARITALEAK